MRPATLEGRVYVGGGSVGSRRGVLYKSSWIGCLLHATGGQVCRVWTPIGLLSSGFISWSLCSASECTGTFLISSVFGLCRTRQTSNGASGWSGGSSGWCGSSSVTWLCRKWPTRLQGRYASASFPLKPFSFALCEEGALS